MWDWMKEKASLEMSTCKQTGNGWKTFSKIDHQSLESTSWSTRPSISEGKVKKKSSCDFMMIHNDVSLLSGISFC